MKLEHSCSHGAVLRTVNAAAEAGANAIKFQTNRPVTITCPGDAPLFRVGGGTVWDGKALHDLYAKAQTPWG